MSSLLFRRCQREGCREPIHPHPAASQQRYCSQACRQAAWEGRAVPTRTRCADEACNRLFLPRRANQVYHEVACQVRAANRTRWARQKQEKRAAARRRARPGQKARAARH